MKGFLIYSLFWVVAILSAAGWSSLPTRYQLGIICGIVYSAPPVGVAYVVASEVRRSRRYRKNAEWAERAKQEWMNGQA